MMMNTKSMLLRSFLLLFMHGVSVLVSGNSLRGQAIDGSLDTIGTDDTDERKLIIGGRVARPGDYPYFAHFDGIACGGTLIAPDIVLTAGHCKLPNPRKYGVVHVGRHDYRNGLWLDGSELFDVVQQVRHPYYNDELCCGFDSGVQFSGVSYDFLLLKLDGESSKQFVSLDTDKNSVSDDDELYVIGFGDTTLKPYQYNEPDRLHEVTVNYMSNQKCQQSSIYPASLLPSVNMCAMDEGEDGCQGDSGGPLLKKGNINNSQDDIQVGVVSWGLKCAIHPGVYARVSEGYSWIRYQVCKLSRNPPSSFRCNPPSPAPTSNPTQNSITLKNKEITKTPGAPDVLPTVEAKKDQTSLSQDFPNSSHSTTTTISAISSTHTTDTAQTIQMKPIFPQQSQLSDTDLTTMGEETENEVLNSGSSLLHGGEKVQQSHLLHQEIWSTDNAGEKVQQSELLQKQIWSTDNVSEKVQQSQLLHKQIWSTDNRPSPFRKKYFASSTSRDRSSLPDGVPCAKITDSQVCCAASDSSDAYKDQYCVPSKTGYQFSTGSTCEPIGWVEDNYDTDTSIETIEAGICDNLVSKRRFILPAERPCSSMFAGRACCMARDIDGYPCVPAKKFSTFPTGTRCEPTTYIAHHQPDNAGTCIIPFS